MRRWFGIVGGWTLLVLAVLLGWLPGPGGIPLAVAGLVLLLGNSVWARRQFVRLGQRYPRLITPLRNILRRRRTAKKQPPQGPTDAAPATRRP